MDLFPSKKSSVLSLRKKEKMEEMKSKEGL